MNTQGGTVQDDAAAQAMLHRMVAVLLRIAMESDGVVEREAGFPAAFEYEYEHRFAEYEYEIRSARTLTVAGLLYRLLLGPVSAGILRFVRPVPLVSRSPCKPNARTKGCYGAGPASVRQWNISHSGPQNPIVLACKRSYSGRSPLLLLLLESLLCLR